MVHLEGAPVSERVLVTGGAGFIGSHLVDRLVASGREVVVLDSLAPQVHGPDAAAQKLRPPHLRADVELVVGDVRDRALVEPLVEAADAVVHLAAAVGLAQSLYEIERFVDVNCRGTARVLEAAVSKRSRVRKLIVASSMSLYGEGRCECAEHGPFDPALRPAAQLERRDFEVRCPRCGEAARPSPTPEEARLQPTTVYAVTKRDQEELALCVGAAYRLPVTALRLFNVYGPRQSLQNPYTGVGAIFCARLLAGRQAVVFEDGLQTRDFTHVTDVAEAFVRALDAPAAGPRVLNVGAGRPFTLVALGELIARELGVPWRPEITAAFRQGDVRHCTAGTSALEAALGFVPRVRFEDGVRDLVAWARHEQPRDQVDRAVAELKDRGLL
jgi:dTDP-L-rhamnose 4-epimerase